MDEQLRQLLDRQEITDLLHEYCRGLDRMDLQAVASVFTDDCIVDYGPEERLKSYGAAGVAKDLRRMWRRARTSHPLSNVQVWFEDRDHARGISYLIAWHERPDGSAGTLWGQYHDRFVRTPAGWRIAQRRLLMNGNDAGFDVNVNRFERIPPDNG